MPNIPCCVESFCIDPANPFENLSAEAPDQDFFIGYSSGWDINVPPLGDTWSTLNCVAFVTSTLSQDDANTKAAAAQLLCTTQSCTGANCTNNGDGRGGGGWRDPSGNPVPVFTNDGQTCTITCPDGLPFNFTYPAGQVQALNKATANAIAMSFACIQAQTEQLCLNDIQKGACVGQAYSATITPSGGTPPILFQQVSGQLPPGIFLTQPAAGDSLIVSGTPTSPGNYSFTIQVTDKTGVNMKKTFTIDVLGITNSPPQANVGSAYSFSFTAVGGLAPYTFSIASGALPSGLSMDQFGNITGTPTVNGTSSFTVMVSDSSP